MKIFLKKFGGFLTQKIDFESTILALLNTVDFQDPSSEKLHDVTDISAYLLYVSIKVNK